MDLENAIQMQNGLFGSENDINALLCKDKIKALVLSDSHFNRTVVQNILISESADILLFTGDGIGDIIELAAFLLPVVAFVRGNNDAGSYPFAYGDKVLRLKVPRYLEINLAGFNVVMTHGDVFSFFDPIADSLEFARQNNADVVLSGHTHRAVAEYTDGILSLNAGSVARPRGCPASFCTMNFKKGSLRADYIFYKIEQQHQSEPFIYRPFIPKQFTNDWLL